MSTTPRSLTEKEAEVFRLVAAGLTNDQIAAEIETGTDNVKMHIRSIFRKVGADSRTMAVSLGFRTGLLDTEEIDELCKQLGRPVTSPPEQVAAEGS